ncbi:MAG: hypothetical protein RJA44_816, partial [Pseudomonadota bacterium]
MSKPTWTKKPLTSPAPRAWSLEARLMFDAAAAVDAADRLASPSADTHLAELLKAPAASAEVMRDTSSEHQSVAASATAAHEVLFVDRDVPDLAQLLAGVRPGVEVVLLDPAADPWTQMSDTLAGRTDLSAVHLVSHGNQGEIILGGRAYGAADLAARDSQLAQWRNALGSGADILLYGCDIAAGSGGREVVDTLARLTGADVAASSNATGGTQADWALEYQSGSIEAAPFLTASAAAGYADQLGTVALNGIAGWVPVMYGPSRDPQGDSQAKSADTDIIGDATHGSLYVAYTDSGTASTADDYLYLRMRIDNPTSTTKFGGVAVVGMDANADGRVDLFMSVDGRNNGQVVRLLDPGSGLNNSPSTTTTAPLPTGWLASNGVYAFNSSNYAVTAVSASTDPNWGASSTGMPGATADNLTGLDGTDVFVSWRVPMADLTAVMAKASPLDGRSGLYGPRGASGIAGFGKDSTVSYVSFTQTQTGPINGDLNGVGASYDSHASFASLGVYTAPMTPSTPVPASIPLSISDNVAGTAGSSTPVTFTFSFSENVSGFDTTDITVTGGSKGAFSSVDGKTYTQVVTPDAGVASGNIEVSVAAGAATGTGSSLPTLSASASQPIDTVAPLIGINTPAAALSGRPTISGTTDLPDGNLVTVTIDPDNDAATSNSVVYQALVIAGAWSLDTSTAVPVSGSLPAAGLNAGSKVSATATDAAGNSSSTVELNPPTVDSLSTDLSTPTLSGTWTYLAGDTLTVTVGGATYTLAPSGNSWSLDLASATPSSGTLSLSAGNTYSVTATVTRGGSSVSDTTNSELVITSNPVVLVDITGGATASGTNTRPVITGTSSNAGGFVIVRLDPNNDGDLSDAVTYAVSTAGGAWTLDTATAAPIAGTVPTGGYTGAIGLRATDSSGAVADTQVLTISTPTIAISSIGSTVGTSTSVANAVSDSYLNLIECPSVVISGTASGASAVDLLITDANGHTVTASNIAVSGGSWSTSGAPLNLSGLDSGTLTVKATLAGSTVSATNSATTLDRIAPKIFNTTASDIKKSSPVITGSCDLPNTVLTVTFAVTGGSTQSVDVTTDGTGSWTTAALITVNISNQTSATVTVAPKTSTTAIDAAGNVLQPISWTQTLSANAATNTIQIGTIAANDIISYGNAVDEISTGVTIAGTTTLTGTATVSLSITDINNVTINTTATATAGSWSTSLTAAQIRTLANGPLTVTATTLDGTVTIRDVSQPTLSLASPVLTISDNISGTATGDFTFTFSFSENVSGFTAGDITLSAGTAGTFTAVDAKTYTLVVTPPASGSGTITATVNGGSAVATGSISGRGIVGAVASQDYAAPALAAAPTLTINVDALASSGTPVITGTTNLAAGAPIVITIDPDNDAGTANSLTYSATVQSGGTWSLDIASATPTSGSLPAGGLNSYAKVSATATNAYGNSTTVVGQDTPAVAAQTSNSTTPTVSGSWSNVAGDTLAVSVNGVSYTPTISGNTWTVNVTTPLADGTYQVVATTSRSGVDKVDITSSELLIDTTATVDITGGASVLINSARPVISGSTTGLAAGTLLTLQLDTNNNGSYDLSYQTAIKADGSWSVDTASAVPTSGSLPADGLNGSTPLRATASDAAGNSGLDVQTLVVDLTPPQIAFSSGIRTATNLPIISGTTDLPPASTLTVLVDPNNDGVWSDAITYTGVVVQSDGSWSVQTSSAISGTVGVRATGTDAAGNVAIVEQPLTLDPNTPSISISPVNTGADSVLDTVEDDSVTLSGSTQFATTGDTVTITITDGSMTLGYTTTVQAGGGWSLTGLNLSSLASGTLTVTASIIDSGGTIYSDHTAVQHNRNATVAIDSISADTGRLGDFVTTDTTVAISGSATALAGVSVVVKDSGNNTVASFSVTTDASGNWSTAATSALAQGNYSIEATVGSTTVSKTLVIEAAPLLASSTPADNATGVVVSDNITLTFNKNVEAGSGYLVLYRADGTPIESFNTATGVGNQGGTLSFNGSTGLTINPVADLTAATGYYLRIDASAVLDASGNPYAGISDATTLNFTTAGTNVAPVNSVPDTSVTPLPATEDTSLAFTGANAISVNDADGNLASTQLTVSHGTLNVNPAHAALISAGSNGGATLTLSGTQAQINAALATLSYQGALNYNGSDTLTALSTDSAGTPLSDTDTVSINVAAVNDAPVLAVANTLAYTENDAATAIDPSLTLSDVDSSILSGATVSIGTGFASGQDVLGFTNQNSITGTYDTTTGVLTLSGSATVAQYQAALRSVTYFNSSEAPSTAARTVSFQVDDGSGANNLSNVLDSTITVLSVNDAAVLSSATVALTETNAALSTSGTLTISDVDSATTFVAQTATAGSYGSFSIDASGAWSYTASSAHDAFVAGQTYTDSFTVTSADGTQSTVTVNITGTNDAPTLVTALSPRQALKNAGFSFTVPTGTFNDIDTGDVLSLSATRADGSALPSWLSFD